MLKSFDPEYQSLDCLAPGLCFETKKIVSTKSKSGGNFSDRCRGCSL